MEELATRVSDDGWQHLSTNLIASIRNLPLELTGMMRKMAVACEHFRWMVRGDLPVEDEPSLEDYDTESDDGSESDQWPSGAVPSALVHLGVFCVAYVYPTEKAYVASHFCIGHVLDMRLIDLYIYIYLTHVDALFMVLYVSPVIKICNAMPM